MIDDVITSLMNEFMLEREEDVAAFLGLQIGRESKTGKKTISYSRLIDRILESMVMEY